MKKYILNSIDNYKDEINYSETTLFLKFVGMIHEFMIACNERIDIENEEYVKHILITGIKNTSYIYKFILLYTKNLELALYHTQKSILYYVEFITQLGEDSQNLLKLTTTDATLFIYKKTVFDINDDYKQSYEETSDTKKIMKQLDLYMEVYAAILVQYISYFDLKQHDLAQLQKTILTKMYKIVEALIHLPIIYKGTSSDKVATKLSSLLVTIDCFNHSYKYDFINKNYLYLIEYCIKKMYKIDIANGKIKNRLLINPPIDIELIVRDYSVCKFFNFLTN
jgi:hypothetical protein|tara:strand:+ start:1205 stop:2047 length:843 start_codon:yes stop_codon:yes gene_type:complete